MDAFASNCMIVSCPKCPNWTLSSEEGGRFKVWVVGIGGSKSSPDIGRLEHESTCVSFASSLGFPSNGSSMSTVLLRLESEDERDIICYYCHT